MFEARLGCRDRFIGAAWGYPLGAKRSSRCKPEIQEGEDKKGACTVPPRAGHHGEGQQSSRTEPREAKEPRAGTGS